MLIPMGFLMVIWMIRPTLSSFRDEGGDDIE
jgi:hypothetical protein